MTFNYQPYDPPAAQRAQVLKEGMEANMSQAQSDRFEAIALVWAVVIVLCVVAYIWRRRHDIAGKAMDSAASVAVRAEGSAKKASSAWNDAMTRARSKKS